jgi:hypothetical protein
MVRHGAVEIRPGHRESGASTAQDLDWVSRADRSDRARARRTAARRSRFHAALRLRSGDAQRCDPEDTLRFYALRLHEIGMIKSTPQEIIAGGTDRRFLDELKRELKA